MGFVSIPHHFAPGTVMHAQDINANFQALAAHQQQLAEALRWGQHPGAMYLGGTTHSTHISAGMFPQVPHHTPESVGDHLAALVTKPVATPPANQQRLAAFGHTPALSGYFDPADMPSALVVPRQVPPPMPYVPPPPPPRDPWEGHDGKDAAAFILSHAFGEIWHKGEEPLPAGWREPTWRDGADMSTVPGYARRLRVPGLPENPRICAIVAGDCLMALLNLPWAVTGHIVNDFSLAVAVVAGAVIWGVSPRVPNLAR